MSLLVYGANGYTGTLVAEEAAARGCKPVVAGRRADEVAALGARLGLRHRVFDLGSPEEIDRGLERVRVLLNCAGPFTRTAGPLAEACLRRGVHYLDVTGEIAVFQTLAEQDALARRAGVMLLPGAGFDVVPSDCLAAHVHQRLPSATQLALAFHVSSRPSRGTATTMVENAAGGGLVRRDGKLVWVPAAWRTRTVDLGAGAERVVSLPWGDVFTAFHTTGIPNIEVYVAAPLSTRLALHCTRYVRPLLASAPVQRYLKRRVRARPPGPNEAQRERGYARLWAEARDDSGRTVAARMRTPEAYALTSVTAVALAERALAGDAPPGFQTPARAYGKDVILAVAGVTREDVPEAV